MSGNWRSVWSLVCGGFYIYCFSFCYSWCYYQVSVGYSFSQQAGEMPLPKFVYPDDRLSYRNHSSSIHEPHSQQRPAISPVPWIPPLFFLPTISLSPLILLSYRQLHSIFFWAWLPKEWLYGEGNTKEKKGRSPDQSFSKHTVHGNHWKCLLTCMSQSVLSGSQEFAGRAPNKCEQVVPRPGETLV